MKPHRNLLESLLSLSTLQASNHILYLMIVPCLVRALGAEHFGALAFSQSFAQYFMTLTDYSFNLSATRTAATMGGDQKELSLLLSTVMAIKVVLLCISAACFFLLILLVPFFRADYALHSVVFLSVLGNAIFPTWIYQGMEKMRYLAVIGVTARGLMLVATLALIHDPADYLTAAWIQSLSLVGSGFIALLIVPAALKLKIVKPSYPLSGRLLREGWDVFLSSVAVSLYTNSNAFVIGIVAGPAEVGLFSASEKLVRAVLNLMSPVTQAVYPHVNSLAQSSRAKAVSFLSGVLRMYGSISFFASSVLFLGSDWIVATVYGPGFESAALLLRWMAFLPFMIALSNTLGVQTMLTFGFHRAYSVILIAAGLLNLMILFPMTILWGSTGAAMAVMLTETTVSLIMLVFVRSKGFRLSPIAGAES